MTTILSGGEDNETIVVDDAGTIVLKNTSGVEQFASANAVQSAIVTITTAQVLALNATPQTLVAAPGAGKFLEFVSIHIFYDYNAAAYAGVAAGEDLVVVYTGNGGEEVGRVETTGFLDQTSDQHRLSYAAAEKDAVADVIPVDNAVLALQILSAEVITGDSPLICETFYRVRTTAIA